MAWFRRKSKSQEDLMPAPANTPVPAPQTAQSLSPQSTRQPQRSRLLPPPLSGTVKTTPQKAMKTMDTYFSKQGEANEYFFRRCENPEMRRKAFDANLELSRMANDVRVASMASDQMLNREHEPMWFGPMENLATMLAEEQRYEDCAQVCQIGAEMGFRNDWDKCSLACNPETIEHHSLRRAFYYCHLTVDSDAWSRGPEEAAIRRHADLNAKLRDAPTSRHAEVARECVALSEAAAVAFRAEEDRHRRAAEAADFARDPKELPSHPGYKRLVIDAEKDGNFAEAIRLCESALAQGWSGDWEKRIERCRKKMGKEAAKDE